MDKIVFTNGCFDILHPGHVDLLGRAKKLGTKLIVGINSDASISAIKGKDRPLVDQESRKAVLLGLESVDDVIIFDEPTPENVIRKIQPDVLVKGGDWPVSQIVGADIVMAKGGEVHSLELVDGYSSSAIINKVRTDTQDINVSASDSSVAVFNIKQHLETVEKLLADHVDSIDACAAILRDTFAAGKKVLICGNGGSAADAQHIAAEFVGRYETERIALPSVALTTDTSALTALANDYDFERIFARQVDALAVSGDCLIGISTSGNSPNVLAAVMAARAKGCKVVGMTGSKGTKLAGLCDAALLAPSTRTARIQECHITVAHIWCEMIDKWVDDGSISPAK